MDQGKVAKGQQARWFRSDISRGATWSLVVIICGFTLYFAQYVVLQHAAFETFGYDLGIMSQAIWNTSHGRFMRLTMHSMPGVALRWVLHFDPILLAFVPIYVVFPVPTTLVLVMLIIGSMISSIQAFTAPDPWPARTSVRYVLEHARCGDTLVLGGLSLSEVEYYLRRFSAPDCIHSEVFPLDTKCHPGWIDVPGLLNQREELESEAATTAARLADQPGSRVWLFYSNGSRYGYEITEILKLELDRRLMPVQTLDLSGTFFDSILVYSTRCAGASQTAE